MRRKVTLSEVADSAGVSVQTVSNVVNNKPIVREETRALVLRHLDEFGYRSNALARSLKTNTSRLIGLVVPSMTNSMYAEVAEVVVHEAEQRGYSVMMAVTMRDAKTELELVNTIIDHSVAGILMSPSGPDGAASKAVLKLGVPYVELLNRSDLCSDASSCDVYEADNSDGARVAVEHLIRLGHRRIAHVHGLLNSTGWARLQGYKQALKEAGIEFDASLVVNGEYTRAGGKSASEQLFAGGPGFSAIFCASDLMAYGAMEAVAEQGLNVPEDVSIIGFDDMSLSSLPGINLSSMAFDPAMMGKKAVNQLIAIIENPTSAAAEPIHDLARCRLVSRGSVRRFCTAISA